MLPFYTTWKHQKTRVFQGVKKGNIGVKCVKLVNQPFLLSSLNIVFSNVQNVNLPVILSAFDKICNRMSITLVLQNPFKYYFHKEKQQSLYIY